MPDHLELPCPLPEGALGLQAAVWRGMGMPRVTDCGLGIGVRLCRVGTATTPGPGASWDRNYQKLLQHLGGAAGPASVRARALGRTHHEYLLVLSLLDKRSVQETSTCIKWQKYAAQSLN